MNYLKISALAAIVSISFAACKSGGFDKTESGLQYKMHTKNEGAKPAVGDIVVMDMIYKTDKDSVIFSTYKQGKPLEMPLQEPSYKGSVEEGFAMLSAGDSATFLVSADSLFLKTFHMEKMPDFLKAGSMLTFIVKMQKFTTKADAEAKEKAMLEKLKSDEVAAISQYIADNNVTAKPTASGLYYIETLAGKGMQADTGMTVSIHYTGKFMDGKVFDSSVQRGQPIELILGRQQVIPGWEEGIRMMKKGGKATLLIPSAIGYGERGFEDPRNRGEYIIPPCSALVFELELVDVKK